MWGFVQEERNIEFWRYRPKETVPFVTIGDKPVVPWEPVMILVKVDICHLSIVF